MQRMAGEGEGSGPGMLKVGIGACMARYSGLVIVDMAQFNVYAWHGWVGEREAALQELEQSSI